MKNIDMGISLTPVFSPVLAGEKIQNRFNGFPRVEKPLKRLVVSLAEITGLKAGVNEHAALILGVFFLMMANSCWGMASTVVDTLTFGDATSEAGHAFVDTRSEKISGGLGESARRLLAPPTENWEGGRVSFTLTVEPVQQNYATVKLWGSDTTKNILLLFCEGKQIGYRHLGDIDVLDIGGDEAAFPGRFFYTTVPLPLAMTRGKTNLNFEIHSSGPIWGYGSTFAQYQKPMTEPTRGIYKIYSHTDGGFAPPADEKQGVAIVNPPVRSTPGEEVFEKLKARVNGELNNELKSTRPLNEMQMNLLARAYFVKWTPAFQNEKVPAQILKGLDALTLAYRKNPELAHRDPATPNPEWFEFGPAGQAFSLLVDSLKPSLDGEIDDGGKQISRRAAYSEMFVAARDWHRQHRRLYSNQTMICDTYGIYLNNRALQIIDPAKAFSETDARRYLYESVGLEPWRDSDPGEGSRQWNTVTNYFQITPKGLTRELGFVGYYGEVLDWVATMYDATRSAPGQPGDEKILAQLEKTIHARAPFRAPGTEDGFRVMRAETIVGWRDAGHYPGNVLYAERATWDASPLRAVAVTRDAESLGYAQQMFEDGQFFISLERQMAQANNLRVTAGLLEVPDDYEFIKAQPPQTKRLPMSPGQPDFVFSDEVDGVVAVKNGGEILYASLYWRARNAVNFLARVHFSTPTVDRIAIVREEAEFEPSGQFYTRPDWVNFGFGNGGPKYPVVMHSAHAGEKLPIAKIPAAVKFKPGDESVYAGKAEFYTLRYGNYLIGMNTSTDKTFELKSPADATEAKELVSGKTVKLAAPLKVAPRSTIVLWLGAK